MLELKLFKQYFEAKRIFFVVMAHAFESIATDIYFIFNGATAHSLTDVLRLFEIFVNWLQIDRLNGFQLIFRSNTWILHSIIQLYLLILYLCFLDSNTNKSHRYIGQVLKEAVAIGLHDYRYGNKAYLKNLIYNLHGYSIGNYIIHAGKTVPIIKNRYKTKVEENNTNINSIMKLIYDQLFSILFYCYVIFLAILIYDSIIIKKNINIILQNIMDYLHNGCKNFFSLLKRNCINILIVFIGFLNIEAARYLIITGEYNLTCFIDVVVFDVNGDDQMILLHKKTQKK